MMQALPLGLVDRSDAGQPAALPRIVPGPLAVHKITPRVSPTIGRREAEFARQRGVTAVAVADQDGTGLNALEHLAGRLAAAMRVDVEPDGVRTLTHPQPGTPSATATPVFPHPPRGLVALQYAGGHHMRADRRRERFEQPREIAQAIAQRARRDRQAAARHPAGDRAKRALARPALQQQGGPHRDPIGRVREQPRHRGRDHGGRAVAAATVAIAPTADAPRMRHHGDLDKIGLDKSVRGIRLPTPPAAALGRRQFPDLRTHRQRRARRPPRSRTAGLLTAPPWRGGARLPLAASAETVPGIVRTHRLQRAQLLLQRRNPTRQPAALRGPRQRLPQDRIRRAQLRHLATQFAILPAQRRARRPPPADPPTSVPEAAADAMPRPPPPAMPWPPGEATAVRPAPLPASPCSGDECRPANPPGYAPRSPPGANTPHPDDRSRHRIPTPPQRPAPTATSPPNPLPDAHPSTRCSIIGSMCPASASQRLSATGIACVRMSAGTIGAEYLQTLRPTHPLGERTVTPTAGFKIEEDPRPKKRQGAAIRAIRIDFVRLRKTSFGGQRASG